MDRCSELASPTAPRTPRDFQWRALSGSNRTGPTDADFDIGAVHLGVHNRIGLWWDAQPNESRLSCAALVKNQIPLRAASASAACYAGAQPISNPLSSPLRRLRRGCYRSLFSPDLSALPCTTLRTRTR